MASGVVRPPFEPSPRRYGLQVPARMSYAWHKPLRRSREERMINGIMVLVLAIVVLAIVWGL